MNPMRHPAPSTRPARRGAARHRRGVISVLAMMFMVLFGSLAVAMALVSKGNLRTAQTHLRVSGALGAVDAGLTLAEGHLREAANRLYVWKGEIDAAYGAQLWDGTFSPTDGDVLDPTGAATTTGLRDVLAALHPQAGAAGTVSISAGFTPQSDWLVTEPIVLETVNGQVSTACQITYAPEPLPDQNRLGVRVMVTGFTWDFAAGAWTRRSAQKLFFIDKNPRQAVLGPSKIMIGKNVRLNGPVGARFTGVENLAGHPLVVRDDFTGLDPVLDQKIADFYNAVLTADTDGDNRLRALHTVEGAPLSLLASNYYDNGAGGTENNVINDFTGDGRVDEFDIFLAHYDADGDGKVALSDALRDGTPAALLTPEFADVDEDLALLIDGANPDRNGDGLVNSKDLALGYRDGVLDFRDRYAKINGPVLFRTQRLPWEQQQDEFGSAIGDYQQFVRGVINATDDTPVVFNAGDDDLPEVRTDSFDTAQTSLGQAADGAPFHIQAGVDWVWQPIVDANGVVVDQALHPVFTGGSPSGDYDVVMEAVPLGSPAPVDYYRRPVIRNKVFKNVVIPMGTNALFENCTFVGVTRVQTMTDNTHPSWQFYGVQNADGSLAYPPLPAASDAQLDNDYFPADGSIIPPPGFDVPRLVVGSTPYVNTKPLSNNIRFHDCLFVGSVVADRPINYTHIRNKLQFTGATRFTTEHPDDPNDAALNPDPADLPAIEKSSMMLPHYSVDIGENNADPNQDVDLHGLIIAGVLDVRGNTEITGALLLTFEPSASDPALQHFGQPVGNPADFNVTLGYFGADDGDAEGLAPFTYNGQTIVGFDLDGDGRADTTDPGSGGAPVPFNGYGRVVVTYDPDLVMPDGVIAPLNVEPVGFSYHEGRTIAGATP
ncbi:MAG: hypothetical protein D6693_08855 [Planctomycetota bacterium]|nr:MAG: hypothetical protein D6693_08855 [Planctomycetota bacterium]